MHKGIILLVKATDKDEAIDQVHTFMEPYGDGRVCDWFVIGGRWSNVLAPADKSANYKKYADSILVPLEDTPGWISTKKTKEKLPLLQAKWLELGLRGNCPHTDHYYLDSNGDEYDVVPLPDCLGKVKEWVKDVPAEIEKVWAKLVEEKAKEKGGMLGYYASELKDLDYGNFCFGSNVYDITEEEAESIPEDITGYFAVMVDIHN